MAGAGAAGGGGTDLPELISGGDIEGRQVAVTEGAVGDFVLRNRDKFEELRLAVPGWWGKDEDSGFELVSGFVAGGGIEACRYEEAAFAVHFQAIGAARVVPVEDELAAGSGDAAVRGQVKAVELAGAAGSVVIVVGHVNVLAARGEKDAVGATHFVGEDADDLAWSVDAVHAFDEFAFGVANFHVGAVTVARVSEVDTALSVEREVIGGVEFVAFEVGGEDGEGAILLGTGDAASSGFADNDTAFGIDERAVGAGGIGAERLDLRGGLAGVELVHVGPGDHVESLGLGVPGEAFAGSGGGDHFRGAGGDTLGGEGQRGEAEKAERSSKHG